MTFPLPKTSALLALCLCLAVAAVAQTTPPPTPPPDQPAQSPTAQENLFVLKNRGDQALARRDYDVAARFYRQYRDKAYHQDVLIDATEQLVKTLIYQNQIEAAAEAIAAVPDKLAAITAEAPAAQQTLTPQNERRYRYWQGRVAFLQDKIDEALPHFLAAAQDPASRELQSQAWLGAGECYASQEKWAESEDAFRKIMEEDLSNEQQWRAALGLIRVLVMQRKYEAAETLIGKYWSNAEGTYRTKIGMLHIVSLLEQGYASEAFTFWREAFVNSVDYLDDRSHYDVVRGLGQALMKEENYESAMVVFARMFPLVKEEAQKQELILDQAEAASGAENHTQAIRQLQLFIQLYPDHERIVPLRFRIAQLYEKLANTTEAIAWYKQVFSNEDAPVDLRFQAAQRVAWLYRDKLTDYANAIEFFDASAGLDVGQEEKARGTFYAAETRTVISRYDQAAQQYGEVADEYPESSYAEEARYKQGLSYYKSAQYTLAAQAFGQYNESFPEGDMVKDSLLRKGLAEQRGQIFVTGMETLKEFARRFGEDKQNAPYALLRASECANAADYFNDAVSLLSRIIEGYPDSEHLPYALYKRAYLHFSLGHHNEAVQDSLLFVERYGDSMQDLTPDVLLWLGDHYSTQQNYEEAARMFETLVRRFDDSPDAPTALYEAAKNAFKQRNFQGAMRTIERLLSVYPEAPASVQARASFLLADIYSYDADYARAAELFARCVELVPRSTLYYAALGRLGECHYNLGNALEGAEAEGHFKQGLQYFTRIIEEVEESADIYFSIVEKARYRKAKVHEILGQPEQAKSEYNTIFYSYRDTEIRNRIFDWYYFARAGFDLARLYQEANQFESAILIYRRLGRANIPVADDASARAEELAKIYDAVSGQPSPTVPAPDAEE